MLVIDKVNKVYYSNLKIALTNVSVSFELGEFVNIKGESGSGKTTLLNIIAGLISYDSGSINLLDMKYSFMDESGLANLRKNYIAIVSQQVKLIEGISVKNNFKIACNILGIGYKEIIKVLEEVDGLEFLNRRVSTLSGGELQRISIARILLYDPKILILDEVLQNLDEESREETMRIVKKVSKDKLVLFVDHNSYLYDEYFTREIFIENGMIAYDRKIKDVDVDSNNLLNENNDKSKLKKLISISFSANKILLFKYVIFFALILLMISFNYSSFVRISYKKKIKTPFEQISLQKYDYSYFNDNDIGNLQRLRKNDQVIIFPTHNYKISVTYNEFSYSTYQTANIEKHNFLLDSEITGRRPRNIYEVVSSVGNIDDHIRIKIGDEIKEYNIVGKTSNKKNGETIYDIFVHDDLITDDLIRNSVMKTENEKGTFSTNNEKLTIELTSNQKSVLYLKSNFKDTKVFMKENQTNKVISNIDYDVSLDSTEYKLVLSVKDYELLLSDRLVVEEYLVRADNLKVLNRYIKKIDNIDYRIIDFVSISKFGNDSYGDLINKVLNILIFIIVLVVIVVLINIILQAIKKDFTNINYYFGICGLDSKSIKRVNIGILIMYLLFTTIFLLIFFTVNKYILGNEYLDYIDLVVSVLIFALVLILKKEGIYESR